MERFRIMLIGGGGGFGGCQYHNTTCIRKIGKYQNTVLKINEIPIQHLRSSKLIKVVHPSRVLVYLKHVRVLQLIFYFS